MKIKRRDLKNLLRESLYDVLDMKPAANEISPSLDNVNSLHVEDQNSILSCLRSVHAILRAQTINYQTSHWQVTGENQAGNHLMFQRLYESSVDEIDSLGEKMVSYFGVDSVNMLLETEEVYECLEHWNELKDHHQRGMLSEYELQVAIDDVYTCNTSEAMSRGLDDLLAGIYNNHETNLYLLQQSSPSVKNKNI